MFDQGERQSLPAMLAHRELRVAKQKQHLMKQPKMCLLTVALNIPGPIKNNEALTDLLHIGNEKVRETFIACEWSVDEVEMWDSPSGATIFWVIDAPAVAVKKAMITLEESFALGRLFDLDVQYLAKDDVATISRSALNIEPRRCFVCDEQAKVCARSRAHDVATLQHTIQEMYETYLREEQGTWGNYLSVN